MDHWSYNSEQRLCKFIGPDHPLVLRPLVLHIGAKLYGPLVRWLISLLVQWPDHSLQEPVRPIGPTTHWSYNTYVVGPNIPIYRVYSIKTRCMQSESTLVLCRKVKHQLNLYILMTKWDKLPDAHHFQNTEGGKYWKAEISIFHKPACRHHRFKIFTNEYKFLNITNKLQINYASIKMAANHGRWLHPHKLFL